MGFVVLGDQCPRCAVVCTIAENDFESDLNNVTTTGTPTLSAGSAVLNAGDGVIFVTAAPDGDTPVHLATGALTTDGTATLRLKVAWDSDDDYQFGEIVRAAGVVTLKLGDREAGTDYYFPSEIEVTDAGGDLDLRHSVALCYIPGESQESEAASAFVLFNSASGTGWTDPELALSPGGGSATITGPAGGANSLNLGRNSITLPNRSVITGYTVGFQASHDGSDIIDLDGVTLGGGDTKGTGTSISSSPAFYSFGGVSDDWGLSLTWRDLQTNGINVVLEFSGGSQLSIDVVTLLVHYTTATRKPGRLSLKWINDDLSEQCVLSGNVVGIGLQAGVASVAGTWDLDELVFSKHKTAALPNCPECCTGAVNCPNCENELTSLNIFLDLSGFSDDNCLDCEDLNSGAIVSLTGYGWAWLGNVLGENESLPCLFQGPFAICAGAHFQLNFGHNDDGYWVDVGLVITAGGASPGFYWRLAGLADPIDCDALDGLEVPFVWKASSECAHDGSPVFLFST